MIIMMINFFIKAALPRAAKTAALTNFFIKIIYKYAYSTRKTLKTTKQDLLQTQFKSIKSLLVITVTHVVRYHQNVRSLN